MISQTGSGGWINTGPQINTLDLVGGRIQNTIQKSGNATTRNILLRPPLRPRTSLRHGIPSTTVTPSNTDMSALSTNHWKRTQWYNQNIVSMRIMES